MMPDFLWYNKKKLLIKKTPSLNSYKLILSPYKDISKINR